MNEAVDSEDSRDVSDVDAVSGIAAKLSPSAEAVMRYIRILETGPEYELFQEDPFLKRLRSIVRTYRGHLYSDLIERLKHVVALGGVNVITQRDLESLIDELWSLKVSLLSPNELRILHEWLKNPGLSLHELAARAELSYPQTRRACQRLRDSGLVRLRSLVNPYAIGFERMLVVLERPTLLLTSPYIEKTFFVDTPKPVVFMVVLYPREYRQEAVNLMKTLRSTADSVSIWTLSNGAPHFSSLYFTRSRDHSWTPDMLHLRLMLRQGGEVPVLGDLFASPPSVCRLRAGDIPVIERLTQDFEAPGAEIGAAAGVSESTVYRIRASLVENNTLLPRLSVNIPALDGRVVAILTPSSAARVMSAWSLLPLTYVSRLDSLEERNCARVILHSALPRGSCAALTEMVSSEMSMIDEYSVYEMAAGIHRAMPLSLLAGDESHRARWSSDFFDARSYGVIRREASPHAIPLDFA